MKARAGSSTCQKKGRGRIKAYPGTNEGTGKKKLYNKVKIKNQEGIETKCTTRVVWFISVPIRASETRKKRVVGQRRTTMFIHSSLCQLGSGRESTERKGKATSVHLPIISLGERILRKQKCIIKMKNTDCFKLIHNRWLFRPWCHKFLDTREFNT